MHKDKLYITVFGIALAFLASGMEIYAASVEHYKADNGFIWLGVVLCFCAVVFGDE